MFFVSNKNHILFQRLSSYILFKWCYYIFLFATMSSQETTTQEKNIRKLIKSLSQVSAVETREIRKDIEKDASRKNPRRVKFSVEKDRLLRDQKEIHLPNLLFTYKLFADKNKRIENFNEKNIENKAYLKRANFEFRKIQLKKQSIARKQHLSHDRYQSTPQLERERSSIVDIRKINIQEIFQEGSGNETIEPDKELLKRIKTAVYSSRKQVKKLYASHCKTLKEGLIYKKSPKTEVVPSEKDNICTARTKQSNASQQVLISPTKSIMLKGNTEKSSPLIEMIRLSTARSKQIQGSKAFQPTTQERKDLQATQDLIVRMQHEIEASNKLKESIVFGQLKKLLYGDRKGRFIQDNTFRTRLKGQCSQEYMKVVKQQENILNDFNGSFLNRRNLVQKFSNILGTLRKVDKVHLMTEVNEFSLH